MNTARGARWRAHAIAGAVAVLVVVGAIATWMVTVPPPFSATALVSPDATGLNPLRLAQTIAALDAGPHPSAVDGVRVDVTPVKNSRFFAVTGIGSDRTDVARVVENRAQELAATLNLRGSEFGSFGVVAGAPPRTRAKRWPVPARTLMTATIAAACGAGITFVLARRGRADTSPGRTHR